MKAIVELAEECMRLAEKAVDQLVLRRTDLAGLSAMCLARSSQSMTSVCILAQHGLNGDAMSVARTIVEIAIDLAYIATDPTTLIPKFQDHDDVRNFQLAKAIDRLHGGTVDAGAMRVLQQKHDTAIANDPQTKRNWAGLTIKERAQRAGSTQAARDLHVTMYDLLYADMCNASHSGYGTLKYTLVGDPSSPSIRFGLMEPDERAVDLAFGSLLDMVSTAANANALTGMDDDFNRLNAAIRGGSPG